MAQNTIVFAHEDFVDIQFFFSKEIVIEALSHMNFLSLHSYHYIFKTYKVNNIFAVSKTRFDQTLAVAALVCYDLVLITLKDLHLP